MSYAENPISVSFPRPGKVLKVVLLGVFGIWLAFAIGLNWAGVADSVFLFFCGNTERVLHGEIWRLFTAPWMHLSVGTLGHVLSALLGLYFFSPALEERWGSARFARFLLLSALTAYVAQMLIELMLPRSLSVRLVQDYWFGALPVAEAVAIAWALNNRGQSVRLFFVLPVSSTGLIIFIVAGSLMYLVIQAQTPEGLIAPFGGMFAGWLFGGGSPSPARQGWLKLRLWQLDAEAEREAKARRRRADKSGFRVISGGRDDDDEEPPPKADQRGRGDRWLN